MAATTMVTQIHHTLRGQVEVSVDGQTGNIAMNVKNPLYQRGVSLPGELAKPFVDMSLHQMDLNRALAFVAELETQGLTLPGPTPTVSEGAVMSVVAQALWIAALGATMKCFQPSESRVKLSADAVFGTATNERAAFDTLMYLRNRHVVHDENDWTQAVHYALVADNGTKATIGDVNCVILEGFDYAHLAQLKTVVKRASEWVHREIERQAAAIRADLQGRTYSELAALPEIAVADLATPDSVAKRRKR